MAFKGDPQGYARDEFEGVPYITDTNVSLVPGHKYKFKICLIGDGGTGKTTYINKVLNGDYIAEYRATQGAVTKEVVMFLEHNAKIMYEVWDTAGQERNAGLKDGYYIGAVAGFFFFDYTSRETMAHVDKHILNFVRACGVDMPKLFILANKVDLTREKVEMSRKLLAKAASFNAEIIEVSAKTGHNFELPFIKCARRLFNNPDLRVGFNWDLTPLDDEARRAIAEGAGQNMQQTDFDNLKFAQDQNF